MEYNSFTEYYLNELFPSAIMFGMSSTDFWDNDPQLYWAYRTFYLKQKELEIEQEKYNAWLLGNMQSIATSISLANAFGKGEGKTFPKFEEIFDDTLKKEEKQLSPTEEFIYWARR